MTNFIKGQLYKKIGRIHYKEADSGSLHILIDDDPYRDQMKFFNIWTGKILLVDSDDAGFLFAEV